MATPKKIKTPFDEFLRDPSNKKILHKNGISVKHFIRTKLNLYVVQSPKGRLFAYSKWGKTLLSLAKTKMPRSWRRCHLFTSRFLDIVSSIKELGRKKTACLQASMSRR